MRLIFDLETNGLLDTVTVIHCLAAKDIDTGEVFTFSGQTVEEGIRFLQGASLLVGHNSIKFDVPVIQKLYPWFTFKGTLRDTLVLTHLLWPDLKKLDQARVKAGKFPPKLIGRYSLEAWGERLGNYKGDYTGGWETFTPEMLAYNVQDVEVTCDLYLRCEKKAYSEQAIEIEHDVARILAMQEANGFAFNEAKAGALYARLLTKKQELEEQLRATFQPWWINLGPVSSKVNNKKLGYTKGVEFTKVACVEFNPGSRDHIANRLQKLYGWQPLEFTPEGKPKVDETTMEHLTYPPVPLIMEYLTVDKRIGALAEGKGAWLKYVRKGRIHGRVEGAGTVTRRMTHQSPNVSQVPACDATYGTECRELFEASPGKVLVGIDASGVQLRCLAHYLAKWDGGYYADLVVNGDVHTANWEAGKPYLKTRPMAKTFIYAELFGAGDGKVASIIGQSTQAAKKLKKLFGAKIKGFAELKQLLARAAKDGFLKAPDGGKVTLRSAHAALSALLQSAEAVIMKWALVQLVQRLSARGWLHGRDYGICANVHDEWQIETTPENADELGRIAVQCIRDAGVHFGFRCPLDGEYKIGPTWASTH